MEKNLELLTTWEQSAYCPDLGATQHNFTALCLRRAAVEIARSIMDREFIDFADRVLAHFEKISLSDLATFQGILKELFLAAV